MKLGIDSLLKGVRTAMLQNQNSRCILNWSKACTSHIGPRKQENFHCQSQTSNNSCSKIQIHHTNQHAVRYLNVRWRSLHGCAHCSFKFYRTECSTGGLNVQTKLLCIDKVLRAQGMPTSLALAALMMRTDVLPFAFRTRWTFSTSSKVATWLIWPHSSTATAEGSRGVCHIMEPSLPTFSLQSNAVK